VLRLLLVEDQALIRRSVADLINLTEDIRVCAEAEDGEQAYQRMQGDDLDVVLMDIQLPRMSGVQVLERLRAEQRTFAPTLLLTTFDDDELMLRGVRAGARGYLLKAVSFEDLVDGIRSVAAGSTFLKPGVTDRVRRQMQGTPAPFPSALLLEPLTRRETEILRLMAGGFSNREIGDALEMSEGTVRNHGSTIFAKLGVRDRTRAVLKGIEIGLL
jgi:DNA-binding NarL/FixJ family response regulator